MLPYLSVTLAWALNFLLLLMFVVLHANGQVPASNLPLVTAYCDQPRRSAAVAFTVKATELPALVLCSR